MYFVCMIKARIRWCTCRVENILTMGKLLSLWFRFLLHSIMFLISQTSYRTYKIISSYERARPVMGNIFLVVIPWVVGVYQKKYPCHKGAARVPGRLFRYSPSVPGYTLTSFSLIFSYLLARI